MFLNKEIHNAALHAGLISESERRLTSIPQKIKKLKLPQSISTNLQFVRTAKDFRVANSQYLKNAKISSQAFDVCLSQIETSNDVVLKLWEKQIRYRHKLSAGVRGQGKPYNILRYSTDKIHAGLFRDEWQSPSTITYTDFNQIAEGAKQTLKKCKIVSPEAQIQIRGLNKALKTWPSKDLKKILFIQPINYLGIHFYPTPLPKLLELYRKLIFQRFQDVLQLSTLTAIADYYHTAINVHLFDKINNSILMADVNAFLKKLNLPCIEHGYMDIVAFSTGYLSFRKYFIAYCNNPKKFNQ